jgi:hypothetical protein
MDQVVEIIGCDRFSIKGDNKSRATVGMNIGCSRSEPRGCGREMGVSWLL